MLIPIFKYTIISIKILNTVIYVYHLVDGGWSNWSAVNCSELYDSGITEIFRSCDNPVPSCGGNNCTGVSLESIKCNNPCTLCILAMCLHYLYIPLKPYFYMVLPGYIIKELKELEEKMIIH